MYVKYGNYQHPDNLTSFSWSKEFRRNPRSGGTQSVVYRIRIKGVLLGTSQSTINTKVAALEAAYASSGQAWGLYQDDGTPTQHYLASPGGFSSPIKVIEGPSYDDSAGPEFATQRSYTIGLEAEYKTTLNDLVVFQESLTITGTGGPRYVVVDTVNGNPIREQLSRQTQVRAQQRGTAVGYRGYSDVPAPIFPMYEDEFSRVADYGSPELVNGEYINWPVSWSYSFTSPVTLFGIPNR